MLSFVARVLVISDVEPRPAVESAALDVADVIRHQIVAELVAFVCAHPKLIRSRTKFNPDRIPDSPGKNVLAGAVRVELKDPRAIRLRGVIRYVGERANRNVHLLSVRRERDVARPMSAAAEQSTAGKLGAQFFRRTARLRVAIVIRKSHDAICVRYVEKLRVGSRWVERNSEWLVQPGTGERFSQIWFSVAIAIA